MEKIDKVPQSFNKTIIDSDLTGLAKDGIEFGLDSLTNDGLLKDIPIVSTIVGLIKTTQNIGNWLFLRKILSFLKGINDIDPMKRERMIDKIDSSKQYRNKVGEQLLFIIDHCEDDVKAEYIAILFRAFLNGKADYADFIKGSSIINRLTTCDFDRFIKQQKLYVDDSEFIGVGLVFLSTEEVSISERDVDWKDTSGIGYQVEGGDITAELTIIGTLLKKIYNQ